MIFDMELEDLIEKYAVKNAIKYDGECNPQSVLGKVLSENPDLRKEAKKVKSKVEELAEKINNMELEAQREIAQKYEYEEDKEEEKGLPDLPNAEEGNIVMRMAPFPSGLLHLGNARMAILNDEYVKKYDGKLILVLDDTAGSKEKKPTREAYEGIPEDLEWLGVDFDEIIYKSDRMDLFYEYAEKFLEKGWAYVCTCDAEKLRSYRKEGKECEHRDHSEEKNLELWRKMIEGDLKEGDAAVRLKTDMQYKDPAFRDRVLLRISESDHPRVGSKYRVWPMLEFSWAIDDHELGMTHILRGKDLVMEDKMERYMWDLLNWEEPEILHHGLFSIKGVKMSTSESRRKISSGEYNGWEDPRTWSLRALKKRGIRPEAIREFILELGMSENDITVPTEALYKHNRDIIDEKANRYFFVPDPKSIKLEGCPEKIAKLPLHPDFDERGERELQPGKNILIPRDDLQDGDIRLKGLYNVELKGDAAKFHSEDHNIALDENFSIIQWLPENSIDCEIVMPDGEKVEGKAEENLLELEEGDVIQFIRFGFVRLDEVSESKIKAYFTHK